MANKLEKQNEKIQTLIDKDHCYAEKMMQLLDLLKRNPEIVKSLVQKDAGKIKKVFM